MSDIEKSPAVLSEPEPQVADLKEVKSNKLVQIFKGSQINDPNVLGKELLQKALEFDEAQLEQDSVKVRRKLDWLVIPMMCSTYMLSFLDKQTLNYSNAYGLQPDTGMSGDDYSWVASALYFGWLTGAYPWNLILQRWPIGRLIGAMLFIWGSSIDIYYVGGSTRFTAFIAFTAFTVITGSGFFAVRFFLGMLEGCVSPAFVLLTSMMWTREEQPFRTSVWLSTNGLSSIIGALLAYGSGRAEGLTIASWKLIFLIVGALTFVWGIVIFLFLPDGAHNAKMLNEYERMVAVWRVSKNQMGMKDKKIVPAQIKEALADPKTYLLFAMGICTGILNGAVANFASAIIKGFGFDALHTSLLQAPGGLFEIVGCVFFGWFAQKKNMMGISIIVSCLPGMAGLIGILKIPIEQRYALVAMAWLQNVLGAPLILGWTLPGLNVAGHTKRSTVVGLFFCFFCAGNITGPHLFLPAEAPRYPTAIKALLGVYCALVLLQIIYSTWCFVENKARDKAGFHAARDEELLEGFDDLTDRQNKHFRYKV